MIASGRITADTEKHTASAAFAFVGRCRCLADIRPLAGLFRPAGAWLQRPPDSFRGGGCGRTRKRPPREGEFRTAGRFCIGFAPAPNERCAGINVGCGENSWPRPHPGYQGFKFDADMADAENQKDLPDL